VREILKGKEPKELEEYRCKPDAVYDGPNFTDVKNDIREQLVLEQGFLCAYCMSRLAVDLEKKDFTKMKVEHWHCQDSYSAEQLDYRNMLGVCLGNEGYSLDKQTCDTRKGNADIKYNPADLSHHIDSRIRFDGNGKIKSDDKAFDSQLNEVLNLNYPRLMENRKGVWDAVYQALSKRFSEKPGSRKPAEKLAIVEELLGTWGGRNRDGRFQEYCAVAIYFLRKFKTN